MLQGGCVCVFLFVTVSLYIQITSIGNILRFDFLLNKQNWQSDKFQWFPHQRMLFKMTSSG